MQTKFKILTTGLIIMSLMVAGPAWAISGVAKSRSVQETKDWHLEDKSSGSVLLKSGETSYCKKDFRVTNIGEGLAEVQVIMGNGDNYYWTQIDPNRSVGYHLGQESPLSTVGHLSENEEARIVNTSMDGGGGMIRVDCTQM